jgi:hypothetical protein
MVGQKETTIRGTKVFERKLRVTDQRNRKVAFMLILMGLFHIHYE